MKRLICLVLFALCLPLTAHADDATKRAKVQEMLDLLHLDKLMAQMMDVAEQQASAITSHTVGKNLSPQQKSKVDAFQKQLFGYIESQLSWKALEPQYVDLYAQTFSEEDIDGMLAFYKSPAGVSMIAKTPELSMKSIALVQKKMLTLTPEIQKMVQDFASTANQRSSPAMNSN
jgi:hypothetical protein